MGCTWTSALHQCVYKGSMEAYLPVRRPWSRGNTGSGLHPSRNPAPSPSKSVDPYPAPPIPAPAPSGGDKNEEADRSSETKKGCTSSPSSSSASMMATEFESESIRTNLKMLNYLERVNSATHITWRRYGIVPQWIHRNWLKDFDAKYVRILGAFYLQLTGTDADVYLYLEPLYNDYSKLRMQKQDGHNAKLA